jgi:hypothetical protein
MATTLGDALIRIRLDPSVAIKDAEDVEKKRDRISALRRKARERIERNEEARGTLSAKDRLQAVERTIGKIRSLGSASAAGAATRGVLERVASSGAGKAVMAAGAVAGTYYVAERASYYAPRIEAFARGVAGQGTGDISDFTKRLAEEFEAFKSRVESYFAALGPLKDQVVARAKLGGGLPTMEEGMDLYTKIRKIDEAQRLITRGLDRQADEYVANLLGQAIRGGQH